ncbi:MAG: metallophosphoesterase family protein [bacterium]|nr:metallophosphoesterase [Gammaproteobacteria bacterium]HIL97632.1 metallophosphoesterase [Pseudomonadales bacterium]
MRLAFISDIHGNLVALDSALADIKKRGIDVVICLGDIVDLGPQPAKTVERLRERQILCIQGNHDLLDENPVIPKLQKVENWTRDQLSTEQQQWLKDLPFQHIVDLGSTSVLCVHGSPQANTQGMEPDTPSDRLRLWCRDIEQDVIVAGHTHLQLCRRLDQTLIINAGSIGMPFEAPMLGQPRLLKYTDYAIVSSDNGNVSAELVRLPLDFKAFGKSFAGTGFPGAEYWLSQWVD